MNEPLRLDPQTGWEVLSRREFVFDFNRLTRVGRDRDGRYRQKSLPYLPKKVLAVEAILRKPYTNEVSLCWKMAAKDPRGYDAENAYGRLNRWLYCEFSGPPSAGNLSYVRAMHRVRRSFQTYWNTDPEGAGIGRPGYVAPA